MEKTPHQFAKHEIEKLLEKKLLRVKSSGNIEFYTSLTKILIGFETEHRFFAFDGERIVSLWDFIRDNEYLFDMLMEITSEWVLSLNLSGIVSWEDIRDNAAVALGATLSMDDNKIDDKNLREEISKIKEMMNEPSYFNFTKNAQWWNVIFTSFPVFLTIYYLSLLEISDKKP